MSDQPYEGSEGPEGYAGYDARRQQPTWPGQQQDDEGVPGHTQQWEGGQTWETQLQPPPQGPPEPAAGTQHGTSHGYGSLRQPLPPETPQTPGAGWGQGALGAQEMARGYTAPGYAQQGRAAQPPKGDHAVQAPVQGPAYGDFAQVPARAPDGGAVTSAPARADGALAYGPPTVTGNPRVTDAQRARAEGRSPIIEPGGQPAALTAALGLLLSGTAAIGQYALVVPLVILQAVTAAGWFRLNGMWPARQGIALAFAGALTADVALLATGRENAPAAILGSLGVWVLLALVLQLRAHADPDERMYGLMATVASAALAIVGAGYLAAVSDAVTVGAAAVAVTVLARALPLPTPASVIVALVAAAGAGLALGGVTELGTGGTVLGVGAGICALIGHRVASYDYPSRFVHFTAGVALPLAAAAPAIYLLGRAPA